MVAPPLAFSNSAIQAFCAASCAVEPAPAISPEASLDGEPPPLDSPPLPSPLELLLELPPPQAARPSTSTQAAANTASHLELDISLLFVLLTRSRPRMARSTGASVSTSQGELVIPLSRWCKKNVKG